MPIDDQFVKQSTTLGIIGTGLVGTAVARLATGAGWRVALANSRVAESLNDLVAELGARSTAHSVVDALRVSDIVVLAVPFAAVDALPAEQFVGKVVIDATNYVPARDGARAVLDSDELTSSELVAQMLPGARVVKAFNSIATHHLHALARHSTSSERSALPISGDDADAKAVVAQLLDSLGYDSVDLGSLAEAWRFGPNTPLYAVIYGGEKPPAGVAGPDLLAWFAGLPGAPVSAEQVRQTAAHTQRGPAGVNF